MHLKAIAISQLSSLFLKKPTPLLLYRCEISVAEEGRGDACEVEGGGVKSVEKKIKSIFLLQSMRLSNEARKNIAIGEITNIMSVDTQRFIDLATFVALLYATPVAICMGIWLIWRDFGPASLPVMAIWIITVFSGIFLNMLQKRYHVNDSQSFLTSYVPY